MELLKSRVNRKEEIGLWEKNQTINNYNKNELNLVLKNLPDWIFFSLGQPYAVYKRHT